jgi:hypothetical protein
MVILGIFIYRRTLVAIEETSNSPVCCLVMPCLKEFSNGSAGVIWDMGNTHLPRRLNVTLFSLISYSMKTCYKNVHNIK